MTLLAVEQLSVSLATARGPLNAVREVSFELAAGETLALVGESGCGKSMTALALLGLTPQGSAIGGEIRLQGQSLQGLTESQWRQLRGNRVACIFQNPMTALNPTMTIGDQIAEPLRLHLGLSRRQARQRVVALLHRLQVPEPERRLAQYPFEFSGGMLQRVMIAMAVACEPALLIADEPTTALDVTVQAQVLALLAQLCREQNMGLLLITHDLAVVAQHADRVAVMYAGEIIEQAPVASLFASPSHPYSQGLLAALPSAVKVGEPLQVIEGSPPDLVAPIQGCGFCPRCPRAMAICASTPAPAFAASAQHFSRCWLQHPQLQEATHG
jgi:oligopeptide/dipeptide ABC transporter ATP-binding protein